LPFHGFAQNWLWVEIVALAADLLTWTQTLAFDETEPARRWEPKRLQFRNIAVVGRIIHTGRRRPLRPPRGWPWNRIFDTGVNVGGTLRLLQAALKHGASRFLYASSTTVYGPAHRYGQDRITEDAALRPMSIYGVTKASAENLGGRIVKGADMTFTALRLPLVYGPDRWYGGALAPLYECDRGGLDRHHGDVRARSHRDGLGARG
jgi:nucleoside-diphosphate-sugar epimerase